ncbi:MAG: lipocalin-like domain-containing protein [Candidatus Udaeobacter sp.]
MLSGLLQILLRCNREVLPSVTHHVRGAPYPNWMTHHQVRYYRVHSSHLCCILHQSPLVESPSNAF